MGSVKKIKDLFERLSDYFVLLDELEKSNLTGDSQNISSDIESFLEEQIKRLDALVKKNSPQISIEARLYAEGYDDIRNFTPDILKVRKGYRYWLANNQGEIFSRMYTHIGDYSEEATFTNHPEDAQTAYVEYYEGNRQVRGRIDKNGKWLREIE